MFFDSDNSLGAELLTPGTPAYELKQAEDYARQMRLIESKMQTGTSTTEERNRFFAGPAPEPKAAKLSGLQIAGIGLLLYKIFGRKR